MSRVGYKIDDIKYKNTGLISKLRKNTQRYNTLANIKEHALKHWITFYRRNIEVFVEHYMGIELYEYQKFWLHNMHVNNKSMIIASRASAKSWLIGVYCIAVCILYPGSKIVMAAKTKAQAGRIVKDKIKNELLKFPNINREFSHIQTNGNEYTINFFNGSTVEVVVSDDRSRGARATLIIFEEFRIIPKEVVDKVLSPFLVLRQPPYLKKKEYRIYSKHEEPRKIYISSAGYKTEWIWDEFKKVVLDHYSGLSCMFLALDYLIAIKHGIKSRANINDERKTNDEISFMMEYENVMFGENSNSFFQLNLFKNLRVIKKAFYPLKFDEKKVNKDTIKKMPDEVRLITCDLARSSSKKADNTIIACMRLIPTKNGYQRDVVYMESHCGASYIEQNKRIKQIFFDFQSDYLIIDLQSFGQAIYTLLSSITTDEERGVEHPALGIIYDESLTKPSCADISYKDLQSNTLSYNASPVIVPYMISSLRQNSEIAKDLKDKLRRNNIKFLCDINTAETYLLKKNEYFRKATEANAEDKYVKDLYLNTYKEIEAFVIETVNLEYSLSGGDVKIENRNSRKDRYTAISYGNYFATTLENKYLKQKKEKDGNWNDYVWFPSVNYNNIKPF